MANIQNHARNAVIAGLGVLVCNYLSLAFTRLDGGVAILWLSSAFLMPWLATRSRRPGDRALYLAKGEGRDRLKLAA